MAGTVYNKATGEHEPKVPTYNPPAREWWGNFFNNGPSREEVLEIKIKRALDGQKGAMLQRKSGLLKAMKQYG